MNIAAKHGFKHTASKSRGKTITPTKKFQLKGRTVDWEVAQANEERARDYRLDRMAEIQNDIYQVPTWSPSDLQLINFVWKLYKVEQFPLLGSYVWDQFMKEFEMGPSGPTVVSGQFTQKLLYIKTILSTL